MFTENSLYNSFSINKISVDNFLSFRSSENKGKLDGTYKQNYLREKLNLGFNTTKSKMNIYAGGELVFNKTYHSHLAGTSDLVKPIYSYWTGADYQFNSEFVLFKTLLDYKLNRYEFKQITPLLIIEDNDSDLQAEALIQLNMSGVFRPYLKFNQYNDMNDDKYFNTTNLETGLEMVQKIGVEHIWKQNMAVSVQNAEWSTEKYLLITSGRITSRFGFDWQLINKLDLEARINDNDDLLFGKNYFETTIQRSLGYTEENQFNRIQASLGYDALLNLVNAKADFQYYHKKMMFFTEAGASGSGKYEAGGGFAGLKIGYLIGENNSAVSYQFRVFSQEEISNVVTNGLNLEYKF